ncbi:hypothetical protein QUF74_03460 [Candidatus Halobeggiatoa sp. HSG11]|nr:hypothetical protein [Candidatus Halobeggiatoa sp. HSG11]
MKKNFIILIIILIGTGLFSRLEPLFDEQRMLKTVSEDGYLMMTIARNMALGLSMSTAEGTIPTNGTQPLTTFLWAGVYWLENGDKVGSIFWITILEFLIATLAAFLLWRFGLSLLKERPNHNYISSLAAATWYASPFISNHTMNGLETGFYGLMAILAVMIVIGRTKPWTFSYSILLGAFLGLVFWTRNDASFLILAICLLHLFMGENKFWQRFWQVNIMGITSILVATPWLIYNKLNFGSIMPISGQAQALTAELGQNLSALPPILVEYFFVFLPIPNSLQKLSPVILLCVAILIGIFFILLRLWPCLRLQERRLFMLTAVYITGFSLFYGLYFGAAHFLSRYFFPLSPFLALLWAGIVVWAWQYIPWQKLKYLAAILFIAIILGLFMRNHLHRNSHQHFQVKEWVEQNIPAETWIAAVQTGTLGYFHDRTINLDGKVNPEALEARKQRQVFQYILDRKIEYLVDWVGLAEWVEKPHGKESVVLKNYFELLVKDSKQNLAVLRRKNSEL